MAGESSLPSKIEVKMDNETFVVDMKNINMSFSGNQVLKDVNFSLKKGEIHSLVGANGAGKSTLIKILNGVHIPDSGTIFIDDDKVKITQPKNAEAHGLAFVHQELSLCENLSVAENMYLGNWLTDKYGFYDEEATEKQAVELISLMGVDLNPSDKVKKLRTAEKQIVEILKALTKDSHVIILDEPTSSLNDAEKDRLFKIIRSLKKKSISIIFISHFLEDVIELSDRVTVLKDGSNNGTFNSGEFDKDTLVEAMMGKTVVTQSRELLLNRNSKSREIVLELKELSSNNKFSDISLKISKGEIIGVCGLLGSGKTEIARAIFGLDDFSSGKILLFNEELISHTPNTMIENGVAFLSEERRREGFIPRLSIRENITLPILKEIQEKCCINHEKQLEISKKLAQEVHVVMSSIEQNVHELSGGNQQKVVIAKGLSIKPKLFILDEPTRGVDIYAKSEIYKILREATSNGTAVLIFSSEIEELLKNCERIVVLNKGFIKDIVLPSEITKNDLIKKMG